MSLWRSLGGTLELELLTADPVGALAAFAQIPLTRVSPDGELILRFQISRRDYPLAAALARRRGERLRILRRRGIYWRVRALAARPVLVVGLLLLLGLTLFLPTRILFFRVEGNVSVPTRQILSAAADSGLFFGVSRRSVRSERIKNRLISAIPQLKWVGVNTQGCVATIRVAEAQQPVPMEPEGTGASSLVASRDGILASLTATRGTPLCQPGQAVTRGQVLISGYTDCGLCVLVQSAQGEAMAYTSRSLTVLTPENQLEKGSNAKIFRRWSLIFGKKRIKLWFGSGIPDRECGRIYEEYPLTLPGGYVLPVCLAVDVYTQSPLEAVPLGRTAAAFRLRRFSRDYLRETMIAGSIQTAAETVSLSGGAYALSGSYSCLESIGVSRQERIGETNE